MIAPPENAPNLAERLVRRFGRGNLVLAPVVVGDRATLGLASCVMGDVIIGADAVLLPHSVLLPGSRVGPGETWGGVPARLIAGEEMECFKAMIRGDSGRLTRPDATGEHPGHLA